VPVSQPDPDDEGRAAEPPERAAAFDEIVAIWRAEGSVPSWPGSTGAAAEPPPEPEPAPAPPPTPKPAHRPTPDPVGPELSDEGHFVPPEPPPLPRIGPPAAVGLALLALGLVLLVAPELVGLADAAGLPLGLLALALGLGWLVLRTWPSEPPGDGDGKDDGAVI
jgi:hypothetical protein